MESEMKNGKRKSFDVFISYRRETGAGDARLLQQALKARGYNVFFDYDSLRDGKFDEKIFEAIDEAPVFVLMLTERALDRCVDADDWVRLEIERAIAKGKKIISVAPSDQKWSFPENLPESLCAVKTEQASELNKASLFEVSIDKMIEERFPNDMRRKRKAKANTSAVPPTSLPESPRPADEMPKKPFPFGERLYLDLDKRLSDLSWDSFCVVAGLEYRDSDGQVGLTAHVVESPWGVFIVGYNDVVSEGTSDQDIQIPTKEQMAAFAESTAKHCGLPRRLVKYFFVVSEEMLGNRPKSFPVWGRDIESVVDELKCFLPLRHELNWGKEYRRIRKCLESLPTTHWGREANIIKHIKAKTVEEVEDGASLLAWVDNPSEELLDAAEKACYFLRENDGWRIAEGVRSWFRVMADRGNVIAMDHYGWLLEGGFEERVRWFRKAAELGGPHAQNSYAYCLRKGEGVDVNQDEALKLLRESALRGNRFGQCNLADLQGFHCNHVLLSQNWGEAFRLYCLSANQGHPWAQYHLGECYEKGLGTRMDPPEAREWYKRAMRPDPWYKMVPNQEELNKMAQDALRRLS